MIAEKGEMTLSRNRNNRVGPIYAVAALWLAWVLVLPLFSIMHYMPLILLAVAVVDDGNAESLTERCESLSALRCVDRVLPVSDWAHFKDAVRNLRIDLVIAKPEQAPLFKEHDLGVEIAVE